MTAAGAGFRWRGRWPRGARPYGRRSFPPDDPVRSVATFVRTHSQVNENCSRSLLRSHMLPSSRVQPRVPAGVQPTTGEAIPRIDGWYPSSRPAKRRIGLKTSSSSARLVVMSQPKVPGVRDGSSPPAPTLHPWHPPTHATRLPDHSSPRAGPGWRGPGGPSRLGVHGRCSLNGPFLFLASGGTYLRRFTRIQALHSRGTLSPNRRVTFENHFCRGC